MTDAATTSSDGRRPAVFVDRDNTLIDDPGYLRDPAQVRLLPGVGQTIARLRAEGFPVVVVSNQSGVARGYFTEDELALVHQRMQDLLRREGDGVDAIYYCPYLTGPDAVVEEYRRDSDLRKPKPGMLFKAAEEMRLDLSSSWMIGDSSRDVQAGRSAGCRTIMIGKAALKTEVMPDFFAADLPRAAEIIVAEVEKARAEAAAAQAEAQARARAQVEAARRAEEEARAAEQARVKAEAEARARAEAEAVERARSEALAAEKAKAAAEAAERARTEAEAARKAREEAEAAQRRRAEEEAAERRRIETEEAPRAEAKRQEAERAQAERFGRAAVLGGMDAAGAAASESDDAVGATASPPFVETVFDEETINEIDANRPGSALRDEPARTLVHETIRSHRMPLRADSGERRVRHGESPSAQADALGPAAVSADTPDAGGSPASLQAGGSSDGRVQAGEASSHERLNPASPAAKPTPMPRVESLLTQILDEVRMARREQQFSEFSLAQLAGAVAQAIALCAVGFGLYSAINNDTPGAQVRLLLGIAFQIMALSGFIIARRR